MSWLRALTGIWLLMATGGMARANPGHEVTIAELSAQIDLNPDLPELYFQRAWNLREVGKLTEARADWERTLKLNPGFLPASRELARTDADEGRPVEGLERLRKAMAAAPAEQDFHRPGCFSVLAELELRTGDNEAALADATAGMQAAPGPQLDLCVLRAEAQRRLGQLEERAAGLAEAMGKLRSFVVKTKWYDAMIDAGRGAEILPEIEAEIANTRYQASWLIRRARIRQRAGDEAAAAADLAIAMEEITTRLRPENPDISLICDRGVIHALQGKPAEAAADLALARSNGADFWLTLPLEALLPGSSDDPPVKKWPSVKNSSSTSGENGK